MSKVINLFGGPGCGKSTLAARIFSILKLKDISCELINEYAKIAIQDDHKKVLENQIYVFGKQFHRQWRLYNKVDYIITDSPTILGVFYKSEDNPELDALILSEFKKVNNVNFLLKRKTIFEENGRRHDIEQSLMYDKLIKEYLDVHNLPYVEIDPDDIEQIIKLI